MECYILDITDITKDGERMFIEIDFNSDEAIYIQLRNQIIVGIATDRIREGGSAFRRCASWRKTSEFNMHTVNKAYSVLKQEGFVKLDRRKGAVIAVDVDKLQALEEMRRDLSVVLAKAACKHISRGEVHQLVDSIFEDFSGVCGGE